MKILLIILAGIYFLALFILINIAYFRYKTFLKLKRLEDPDYKEDLGGLFVGDGGRMAGGGFMYRTPFPIEDDSQDENIIQAVKAHNRIIKLFWLTNLLILPIIAIKLLFD